MSRLTDAVTASPSPANAVLVLYKEIWTECAGRYLRPGAKVKVALVAAGFEQGDAEGLRLRPRTTAYQIVERLRSAHSPTP